MRIPLVFVVSAALLLASSCSRDKSATPATAPAAAPPAAATPAAAAPAAAVPKQQVFGVEELDQMVAPIALYPDPLVAQVLMAATYPGDVSEAAAWAKANPDANGDAAVRQVANQPWDPSVQSLVAFPQALATLGQDPPWVQRLGDAFLAQPDDVMDAIQRLRHKAQSAGNLASNEYQKVSVQPAAAPAAPEPAMGSVESYPAPVSNETIIIESADPETVYVPSYDPNTAYGQWDYPSYPPSYYPPPQSYYPMGGVLATGLAWGVGFAVADSLWGDADWDNGDIDIDVDSYNNINSNRQIDRSQSNWNHNAANRDGVPYRDQGNRDRNNRRLDGAENRGEFRGEDANRTRSREQARQSMERRGVDTPARSNQEARDRAQSANRDQQRQRADATNRDRQQADRSRQQADRSRSQAQSRDRAQASQRQQQASRDTSRRQQETRHRQSQSNTQARSQARSQQQSRQSRQSSSNAFQGASRPQQSRQSAQRGQQSHASAQRGGSRGGGGQQAQRSAPQRQSRR